MIWEFIICLLWVFFCTGWLCNDCLVGNVLACWVRCLGQRLEWCLPCLIIHQLIPLCFDHMKLGSLSRWPCYYFSLFLLGLKNVCSGLSTVAMLCQEDSVKSQDSLLQVLMLQLLTCRLSAAARALSSQRATSPSSSASSTASSGPPTSGSFTRRQSGSQEVLRYRIYLCPFPPPRALFSKTNLKAFAFYC